MPQKLMTQKEFVDKLRKEMPELSEFNDSQIVQRVLQRRPDLVDKIENPMSGDVAASNAQAKAERGSKSIVNPELWDKHPRMKQFVQSAMQALPGIGAVGGGLLATPETMGTGTVLGGALGAGVGRGAMDIGNQLLGLEETTPMQKAQNIGMDTALTAVTPGLMSWIKNPIGMSRAAAGTVSNIEDAVIPPKLRPFVKMPFWEKWAKGGNKFDPLVRPRGNNLGKIADEVISNKPRVRLDASGKIINKETGEELASKVTDPWKSPEGIRLLELTELDLAGKLTGEQLKEAQMLNKVVRNPGWIPADSGSVFNPEPTIKFNFSGNPSKPKPPYKPRFSMEGVNDKIDNPKKR